MVGVGVDSAPPSRSPGGGPREAPSHMMLGEKSGAAKCVCGGALVLNCSALTSKFKFKGMPFF